MNYVSELPRTLNTKLECVWRAVPIRFWSREVLCIVAVFILMQAAAISQETTGEISGNVRDSSGAHIVGAEVRITQTDTGRTWTTPTLGDGSFRSTGLVQGRYQVRIGKDGFAPIEFRDVSVFVGNRIQLDAVLKLAPFEQSLTVIGSTPLLDLTGTAVSHHIPAEEFDRLPKARNFQSLLSFLPSVNSGADQYGNVSSIEGGYQVNGASAAENLFVIDGVTTNSLIQGQSRQSAIFEFL